MCNTERWNRSKDIPLEYNCDDIVHHGLRWCDLLGDGDRLQGLHRLRIRECDSEPEFDGFFE